jgi:hypothetical protein
MAAGVVVSVQQGSVLRIHRGQLGVTAHAVRSDIAKSLGMTKAVRSFDELG